MKQTLNSAVCSKQLLHYVTPLEYRYQIRYSPDKNRILLYRFDYGQKTLYTDLKIYDADFNLLEEGIIPVDHMYMVYGYAINNRGEIFIAKANRSGKVALIRYKLALQEFKYLEVEMNNYQRDNLKMYVFSDDIVYLAKMNKTQDKLHSVSYTVFDFESGRLDKYNTYVFTEQKQREIKEKEDELSVNVGDDFRHFVISDFYVNENKEVFFILEEEEIVSNSYKYNEKAVEDIKTWFTEDAQVRTGTLILYKIDADKKLGWSTFVVKDQLANISDGLNIASYKMNFKDDHINLIYAYKKKGILMNSIAYKKFDLNSGKLLVEKDLVNTQKLTLLRPYLYLLDDDLYYVGKKGLVGKKSFFTKQKL